MRKTGLLFLTVSLILSTVIYAFGSELTVESRITEATIYPDSALINRRATLKLNPGEYQVIFSDIIPDVDENSLRVSGIGSVDFKLFGAQLKREYLEEVPSERIKALAQQIQKIEDEITQEHNLRNLLAEEKNFLDSIRLFSNGQIPKDLITKMPLPKDLDEMLKFLDEKLKNNYSQVLNCEFKVRDLTNKVNALRQELSQISGPVKKMKRSIVVDLGVEKSGALDLNVSYLVRGASWQPVYDARASFEKNQVELISYGIVRQSSGEDWEDVDISLSTAKPSIGGRMPYVSPWFLRPYQPRAEEWKAKSGLRKSVAYQTMAFDKLEVSGIAEEAIANKPAEIAYSKAEEKGIAVVYKLPRKATIKSDATEHKLPVSSQVLQAKFAYSTYPRVNTCAYLGSRVTNAKDLQLLGGRVNIFLEGDFVGSSGIDNIAPGEEFDLYLGVDESVKVKRDLVEKKVDDILIAGIPSPTKKTIFKYKTNIENYKSKKINVVLFEAMPVSEDERIKIRISNVSLEPKEKDWQSRKGVWRWELELEPRAKKEIFYTYTIEHPRDMQVEGL